MFQRQLCIANVAVLSNLLLAASRCLPPLRSLVTKSLLESHATPLGSIWRPTEYGLRSVRTQNTALVLINTRPEYIRVLDTEYR